MSTFTLLGSELRLRRRAMIGWSIALVLLSLMMLAFYPAVRDQPGLDEMMLAIPEEMRPMLGALDMTSPAGYLSSQLYLYFLPALLFVFAIGRGAAAIAGEEEDRTLDLLLSQPISRTALYAQKLLALLAQIALLVTASALPLMVFGNGVGLTVPLVQLLAVNVQLFVVVTALSLFALAVGAATGRRGVGIAVASGYAFIGYLVDGLGQTVTWLEHFRPLTTWRWYEADAILRNGFILGGTFVLLLATVCITMLGVWGFGRRSLR